MKAADQYCTEKEYRGFAANQALLNLGYKYMNPLDDDTLVYADEEMQQLSQRAYGESSYAVYGSVQRFLP